VCGKQRCQVVGSHLLQPVIFREGQPREDAAQALDFLLITHLPTDRAGPRRLKGGTTLG
jgi:hypothetical protein